MYVSFKGKNVIVVGMGIEGGALAQYMVAQGANITVHHWMTEEELRKDKALGEQFEFLKTMPIVFKLGKEYLNDILSADAICVLQSSFSSKYPQNFPRLSQAKASGIPFHTDMSLLFDSCPAPIVGITGTKGKTTTTKITGAILKKARPKVFIGGNVGYSPLEILPEMTADSLVVLELSNYQLESLNKSPHISVITNITPDHLIDYHGSMKEYIAAKQRILDFQEASDFAVLNLDNKVTRNLIKNCRSKVFPFSRREELSIGIGAFVRDGEIFIKKRDGEEIPICFVSDLKLIGGHNVENVLAAAAIAVLCDVNPNIIRGVVTSYTTGEHKLEFVKEKDGVKFFNDSEATNPASCIAALNSFEEPIILIAGGRDKGLPYEDIARTILEKAKSLILVGESANLIEKAVRAQMDYSIGLPIYRCLSLEEAVGAAAAVAQPGDIVLLSPACASFDAFSDFAERGERFRELVKAL